MTIYVNYLLLLKSGEIIAIAVNQEVEVSALTNKEAITKLNAIDDKGHNYVYYQVSRRWGSIFYRYKNQIKKFYCVQQLEQ